MNRRSPLVALFLTVFIDLVGFGFTIPLMPFYAQRMHASNTQVTALNAVYSLMQFLFIPLWGGLSDRVGRRPVLLASIVATIFSMSAIGLATTYEALFLVRMAQGIATANIATAMAYIADVTKPEERARGMGLIGAAFGLGFILGPFLGGVLGRYSHTLPGYAASGLAVLNFALAWRNLPESLPPEVRALKPRKSLWLTLREQLALKPLREALKLPGLGSIVAVLFVYLTAFTALESTFALYICNLYNFAEQETGYFFGFIGLTVTIVQGGLIGRLSRWLGEVRLTRIGLALLCVGFVLMTLLERPGALGPAPITNAQTTLLCVSGRLSFFEVLRRAAPLFGVVVFTAAGSAVINPSLSTLTSKLAARDTQGGTLGAQQSVGSLARVLGPLLAGWSFDVGGAHRPYAVGAALMALSLLLSLGLRQPARAAAE